MSRVLELRKCKSVKFHPLPPYNFDANFHKPSHFPSSNSTWSSGFHWITMLWRDKTLGLKFENNGSIENPCIKLTIFSPPKQLLTDQYRESLTQEISWRFNFNQDISKFCSEYKKDEFLEAPIRHWKGMKPIASNSLYEMLVIYVVLQNATVKRSVQMLENLFARFGEKSIFR